MPRKVPPLDDNAAIHRRRGGDMPVESDSVDRSLQLSWLRKYPAYKNLIKERVSEAAIQAEKLSRRIDDKHKDVDYLGKEIDGCG